MEENGWTAWVAGEGYDDLWDHESGNHESETLSSHAWRVRFKDGNPEAEKSGRHELGHKVNYYRGSDESKWVSGLDAVGQVRYKEVWPGIELIMDNTISNLVFISPHCGNVNLCDLPASSR